MSRPTARPMPRWIIPLDPGVTEDGPAIVVSVTPGLEIDIDQAGHLRGSHLPLLSAITAVQLGQALLDASAWCGRAKTGAKKR